MASLGRYALSGDDDSAGANGLVGHRFQRLRDFVCSDPGGKPELKRVGRRVGGQNAKRKVCGIRLNPGDDIGHEIGDND